MIGYAALACALALLLTSGTSVASRTVDDLRFEMSVDRVSYAQGDPVRVAMRVSNASGTAVTVKTTGQAYDVLVRQRGALVWQWSHDKAFAQVVRSHTLVPGEAMLFEVAWDQRDLQGRRVDPGRYDVSCVFLMRVRDTSAPVEVGPIRLSIGR
jgi:hypothetical protein